MIWAQSEIPQYPCIVCGYETIGEKGKHEICEICGWQDEFESYGDPSEVIGGANGDYSITEARKNFARYGSKYRPSDHRFPTNPAYLEATWKLRLIYGKLKRHGWSESLLTELNEAEELLSDLPRRLDDPPVDPIDIEKLEEFIADLNVKTAHFNWRMDFPPRHDCRCCGFQTLLQRSEGEICDLCGWVDKDDDNDGLTVPEARENFELYGSKYGPTNPNYPTNPEYMQLGWRIKNLLLEIKRSGPTNELYMQLGHLNWKRSHVDPKKSK